MGLHMKKYQLLKKYFNLTILSLFTWTLSCMGIYTILNVVNTKEYVISSILYSILYTILLLIVCNPSPQPLPGGECKDNYI